MIFTSSNYLGYIPKRIISLVPSQTELLYYLGLEDETIAISKFCVHPEQWFRNKTKIGGTKSLNIEKIIELSPDLIIANNEENVKEQVDALAEHFPVWVTDVTNLETAMKMIIEIGELTGTEEMAGALNLGISDSFLQFEKELNEQDGPHLRSAYLIWRDPYMTIGADTFIHDMMKRCGFRNIFENTARYPEITVQQLSEKHCELLLLSSEPFPFAEKHIAELKAQLPSTKIILVDGEMFSWYGSRLLLSPAYFKQIVVESIK